MAKVTIVGGGIIGLCAAYYALADGHEVTVLDKGEVGHGSSWGNAGWITPSHVVPLAAPGVIRKGLKWMLDPESPFYIQPRLELALAKWLWDFRSYANEKHVNRSIPILGDLCKTSLALFKELNEVLEHAFGFEEKSLIFAAKTDTGLHSCLHEVAAVNNAGMEARPLLLEEMIALEPTLRADLKGGALFKIDSHMDPAQFILRLTDYLRASGATILENTAVKGFEVQKSEIKAVRTAHQSLESDVVVLAIGAWSSAISQVLGLKLPVQPGKGYSLTVPQTRTKTKTPVLLVERSVAITPLGDNIRYAGTMEMAGMGLKINQRRVEAIKKAIPAYLTNYDPTVADKAIPWAGLRPCSPDGLPLIGAVKTLPNLFVATGHAMIGVTTATGTGKIIADLIANRASFMDHRPFAVERF